MIVAAVLVAYSNSFSGPFVLDDQGSVIENRQIRDWSRPADIFFPAADSAVAGRPLVNVSFALNYAAGGLDVAGYHAWNLAVHLVCALLAFAWLRRTFELPRVRSYLSDGGDDLAFAAALVWAVHPLNTEVVDYTTQRTESMMAAFFLLTLYAACRALTSTRTVWRVVAIASCALGMACKEPMVTAPLMVVIYDRVFTSDSWREAMQRRRTLYAGLAATWVIFAVLVASGPRAAVGGFSSGVSVWTYLLNQTEIITEYLRLAFWPRSLVVFYGWPEARAVSDVWPYAALIAGLLGATAVALPRAPMLGFLGVWFFVTLAPTSSIVPIATEVGAERRMYLPLLAVVVLVTLAAHALIARVARTSTTKRASAATLLAAVCLGSIVLTRARNREYASAVTLARTVVERRPTAIAHHILGEQLILAGRLDEGIVELREAVAAGDSKAGYQLGVALAQRGQRQDAIERLQAFVATEGKRLVPRWLEPSIVEVVASRLVMGNAFLEDKRPNDAIEQARAILAVAPNHVEARQLMGAGLFAAGRYEEASVWYGQFAAARPNDASAWMNVGLAFIGSEKLNDAIAAFGRAVTVDPGNATTRRLLAMALLDRGDVDQALPHARQAVALAPGEALNRDLLNRALAAQRAGGSTQRNGSPH